MSSVPRLRTKPMGPGLRAAGLLVPGIRTVSAQIAPYTRWWDEQNQRAVLEEGPLWIALGDSSCLGIGASHPSRGWVGSAVDELRSSDPSWRVINLAMSGARLADVLGRQLDMLSEVLPPTSPDSTGPEDRSDSSPRTVVSCCVGTNDVFWTRIGHQELRAAARDLAARLPTGSLVATIAGRSERVISANRALKQAASDRGLVIVEPWNEPGPSMRDRLAADRFHPSDVGHALIGGAFLRALSMPR